MSDLLVENGRVYDPAAEIDVEDGGVLIEDGTVSEVVQGGTLDGSDWSGARLDAGGNLILPGLIDIHTHLRDPGQTHKETLETGLRAAANGGFTTVCCMPNTEPPLDRPEVARDLRDRAGELGICRLYPVGAISKRRAGEKLAPHRALFEAGCLLFSDDGRDTADSSVLLDAMVRLDELGSRVTLHAEDPTLSGDGVITEGAVSAELGVEGQYPMSEEVAICRAMRLAEYAGASLHIAHLTTARGLELVGQFRERGLDVTCEVTPHHLLLTQEAVREHGAQAKVNPPLRTERDRRALLAGLDRGEVGVLASDHAPHTVLEKSRGLEDAPFGFTGLDLSAAFTFSLVHEEELSLARWVESQTAAPAAVLGLGEGEGRLGSLEPGSAGDVTVFDSEREWTASEREMFSRSANTPFLGRELTGRAVATVVGGEPVEL